MISFIVPAHNEEAGIGRTLKAIHESARVVGQPYEIIVVDDASTDATVEVARQHKAIVVPVSRHVFAAAILRRHGWLDSFIEFRSPSPNLESRRSSCTLGKSGRGLPHSKTLRDHRGR